MKTTEEFPVSVILIKHTDEVYVASIREYPAIVSQGKTKEEAIERLFDVFKKTFKEVTRERCLKQEQGFSYYVIE